MQLFLILNYYGLVGGIRPLSYLVGPGIVGWYRGVKDCTDFYKRPSSTFPTPVLPHYDYDPIVTVFG
jgi:hypothetical protein